MSVNDLQRQLLQQLPGVDTLLEASQNDPVLKQTPKTILLRAIRDTLSTRRRDILDYQDGIQTDGLLSDTLIGSVKQQVRLLQTFKLQKVINGTGVVVHTNLGRSCLAQSAIDHMVDVAGRYSNLEFDLARGRRGSRYSIVEDVLCELTGAEAAVAVNNNAAAVLLCLDTLACKKEVVISRGELVEIGGSFRIPDVMAKSGAILKEVGTTNRTHLRDYENGIGTGTGLLLKVHTSNYSIVGFTASVSLADLVTLAAKFGLPVMEDLGSGNLIDFSRYGIHTEPTVQASVAAGADVITFSGDKLLGGPQAGLIVGKKPVIDRIKANPLTRALRIDKLTLAALEATLHLYRDETQALAKIPTVQKLTIGLPEIERRAQQLRKALKALNHPDMSVSLLNLSSKAGGGSLPLLDLPSCCVGVDINGISANTIEIALRNHRPPVIGRIENDLLVIDPRTLQDDELEVIAAAFDHLIKNMDKGV